MTATRTSTASAEAAALPVDRPRIGLLGIMQSLYDDMLPGITERQAKYAADVAAALAPVADVVVTAPAKERDQAEARMRELEGRHSPAVLMRSHGVFTIGPTARDAIKAAVMCEDVARTVHLARALGDVVPLDPESIEALHDRYQNVYGQR